MKQVRYLLTAAALLAAAACANADGITSPRSAAPPRLDGGFIGSGGRAGSDDDAGGITSGTSAGALTVPDDSTAATGGEGRGGFIGSGG